MMLLPSAKDLACLQLTMLSAKVTKTMNKMADTRLDSGRMTDNTTTIRILARAHLISEYIIMRDLYLYKTNNMHSLLK